MGRFKPLAITNGQLTLRAGPVEVEGLMATDGWVYFVRIGSSDWHAQQPMTREQVVELRDHLTDWLADD